MRIKEHRAQIGMSQDDLASRVYVSRQTISSWENDKTYPDVQSLLLLSAVFGTTVDELIKGDVKTMEDKINHDVRTLNRVSYAMLGVFVLMLATTVWFALQLVVWDWEPAQTAPTIVLFFVLWGVGLFFAVWGDRIKKEHDLVVYQEIKDFLEGRPVDRGTAKGKRERALPSYVKGARIAGVALAALVVGAICGWCVAAGVDKLIGM